MMLVHIYTDGMMEGVKIKGNINIEKKLLKLAKNRGTCELRELYSWTYDKKKIICFGWLEGDKNNKNKHSLVSGGYSKYLEVGSSEIDLYGDIFVCCVENNKLSDFDISEYGEFYTNNDIYDEYDPDSSDNEIEEDEGSMPQKYISSIKKNKNNKDIERIRLKRDTTVYI